MAVYNIGGQMGREQHYVGLHYRTKFQIGATNVTYGEDDYFDGSDQKFQFNHPRTSIKDELSPVQLPLKIQKQKKLGFFQYYKQVINKFIQKNLLI